MSDLVFSVKISVGAELKRFKSVSASDPTKGKQIYSNGEKLIVLAGSGELNQFKRFASEVDREDILSYFSAKALMASLIGGHLVLSGYILDNGYPLQLSIGLPSILNDCLRVLCDYECVPIVKLLVEKGLDVNMQEQKTWLAPLHIAVQRELVDTIQELVSAGADVNIVGGDDAMPLSLAEKLPASSVEKQRIVEFLTSRGARSTWRRQESSGSGGGAGHYVSTEYTSSTQIRAGPSNSNGNDSGANPVTAGPSLVAPASNKVRFNGSQLSAVPVPIPAPVPVSTTSLPNNTNAPAASKKVSFNGASLVLEQVTLAAPAPPAAPARAPTSLPLPKVSVSTASGERLRPPPRVAVAAGETAVEARGAAESEVVEEVSGVAEVDDEIGQVEGLRSAVEHLEISHPAVGSEESPEVVGSFQMSEDGAAMLFSTG